MAVLAKRLRKPLTTRQIERWIEKNQEKISKSLGVDDWSIVIKVAQKGMYSVNTYEHEYKKAQIVIVPECAWTYEHLEQVFRHELCHLLVSPLTELEQKLLPLIPKNARKTVSALLNAADEKITDNMVLIQRLNGLCPPLKEECYYSKAVKR